jgi:hypothetical protein
MYPCCFCTKLLNWFLRFFLGGRGLISSGSPTARVVRRGWVAPGCVSWRAPWPVMAWVAPGCVTWRCSRLACAASLRFPKVSSLHVAATSGVLLMNLLAAGRTPRTAVLLLGNWGGRLTGCAFVLKLPYLCFFEWDKNTKTSTQLLVVFFSSSL